MTTEHGKTTAPLSETERHWLLTAAMNRPLWRAYQEQVQAVRDRSDLRTAAALEQRTAHHGER